MECLEIDDTQLLERAREGDGACFERLCHRHYPMMYAFAYRLCLERADAQDLTQETFIKAARNLSGFEGRASFKNWLYQIMVNAQRDWLRSRGRKAVTAGKFELERAIAGQERTADFDAVHRSLGALAGDLRQAVVLVYFEELSHGEAARILGCAETTVSWRIFRAKRILKGLLRESSKLEAS